MQGGGDFIGVVIPLFPCHGHECKVTVILQNEGKILHVWSFL